MRPRADADDRSHVHDPRRAKLRGADDPALIAPGLSYAGAGWEFAIEGLVPASRATGRGVGAIAQFHLSLDFVAPETIGRPLFAAP